MIKKFKGPDVVVDHGDIVSYDAGYEIVRSYPIARWVGSPVFPLGAGVNSFGFVMDLHTSMSLSVLVSMFVGLPANMCSGLCVWKNLDLITFMASPRPLPDWTFYDSDSAIVSKYDVVMTNELFSSYQTADFANLSYLRNRTQTPTKFLEHGLLIDGWQSMMTTLGDIRAYYSHLKKHIILLQTSSRYYPLNPLDGTPIIAYDALVIEDGSAYNATHDINTMHSNDGRKEFIFDLSHCRYNYRDICDLFASRSKPAPTVMRWFERSFDNLISTANVVRKQSVGNKRFAIPLPLP